MLNNKANNNKNFLYYSHEVSGHLDNVQDDLDMLKDLLRNELCSFDQSTVLDVSLPIATISTISPPSISMSTTKQNDSIVNLIDSDSDDTDSVDENMENDNALIEYLKFTASLNFQKSCNYFINGNLKKDSKDSNLPAGWNAFHYDIINYFKDPEVQDC